MPAPKARTHASKRTTPNRRACPRFEELESRLAPAVRLVDAAAGQLQFDGSFADGADSASGTVIVSKVESQGAVALLQLDGGVELFTGADAHFTTTGAIDAILGAGMAPFALLGAGNHELNVERLLADGIAAAAANLALPSLGNGVQFDLTSIRLGDHSVDLQGSLHFDQLAGLQVEVGGANYLHIGSAGIQLDGFIASMTPNRTLTFGGASFYLGQLQFGYSSGNGVHHFEFGGAGSITIADHTINLEFGNSTAHTPGIVIEDGTVTQFAAHISSESLEFGGVTFTNPTLDLSYQAAGQQLAIIGGATIEVAGSRIGVHLGGNDTDGLVLENGQLQSLTMSVEADFDLKGLHFGVHDLTIGYDRGASRFLMYGSLFVSTGGDSPTLNHLTATLGDANNPGLVIVGGDLQSLNIGISGSFSLFGVTLTADDLTVQYVSSSGIVQIQGGVAVQLSNYIRGSVSLPNGGITINTQTGAVQVNGLRLEFDVQLGAFRIDDLFVEYTDARPTGGQVTIAAGGTVTLPGGFSVGG